MILYLSCIAYYPQTSGGTTKKVVVMRLLCGLFVFVENFVIYRTKLGIGSQDLLMVS